MELPKRKSPRIAAYDYSTPNYYFITICTYHKECIFGSPDQINEYGKIARECLLKIPEIYPNVKLDNYVIMPNHIHGIFIIQSDSTDYGQRDLAVILGQYKMSVTKKIRLSKPEIKVWQRSFHDHIIRNQKSYENIWLYIEHNPVKWEEDRFHPNNWAKYSGV